MNNKQDLLETARNARVATFETCKELNWQYPTEKVWANYNGQVWVLAIQLPYDTFFVSNAFEIMPSRTPFANFQKSVFTEIIPAPSFEEILEKLTKEKDWGLPHNLGFSETKFGYMHPYHSDSVLLMDNYFSFIINNHLSEASARLYLQLKKENVF